MNEDSVQIEFTDEELEGNVVDNDPQSFLNNEGAGNDTQTVSQKTGGGTETLPEGNETQGQDGGDTEGAPAGGDTDPETQDVVLAQTDADLAVAHGVTEDEIRYAKSMGWSPKDKFRGDPKDWKGPKEFIDIAEQSAPVLRERMREMSISRGSNTVPEAEIVAPVLPAMVFPPVIVILLAEPFLLPCLL